MESYLYGGRSGARTVVGVFEARCTNVTDLGMQPVRVHGVFRTMALLHFTFELLANAEPRATLPVPLVPVHVEVPHAKRRGRELKQFLDDWFGARDGPARCGALDGLVGAPARLTLGHFRADATAGAAGSLCVLYVGPGARPRLDAPRVG